MPPTPRRPYLQQRQFNKQHDGLCLMPVQWSLQRWAVAAALTVKSVWQAVCVRHVCSFDRVSSVFPPKHPPAVAPGDHHAALLHCCAVLSACADAHQALAVKAVHAHGCLHLLVEPRRHAQLPFVIGAPSHLQAAETGKEVD